MIFWLLLIAQGVLTMFWMFWPQLFATYVILPKHKGDSKFEFTPDGFDIDVLINGRTLKDLEEDFGDIVHPTKTSYAVGGETKQFHEIKHQAEKYFARRATQRAWVGRFIILLYFITRVVDHYHWEISLKELKVIYADQASPR